MALTDAGYNAADFSKDRIFVKPAQAVTPGAAQQEIADATKSKRALYDYYDDDYDNYDYYYAQ